MANSESAAFSRQLVVNIGGNCFRVLTSFAAAIVAARSLGNEGFGQTNIIVAATTILSYIPTLGFDSSLPVLIAKAKKTVDPDRKTLTTLQSAILSSGIFGLISGFIAIVITIFARSFDKSIDAFFWPMVFMILHSVALTHGNVLGGALRGMKIFHPVIIRDQFVFPLAMLLSQIVAFQFLGVGVVGYGVSSLIAAVLAYITVAPFAIRIYRELQVKLVTKARVNLADAWKDVSFSFPLGIMTTLEPLYVWLAVLLAGHFQSAADVGYFSISLRLAVIAQFFATAIGPIFIPYMATYAASNDKNNIQLLYNRTTSLCLRWSLLALGILATFHKEFFQLFGSTQHDHRTLLLVTIAGIIIDGMFAPAKYSLVALGRNKINAVLYSFAIILNLLLASLLNEKFGIIASAASFSIVLTLLNVIRLINLYKIIKIRVLHWADLVPIISGISIFTAVKLIESSINQPALLIVLRAASLMIFAAILFLPVLKEIQQMVRLKASASKQRQYPDTSQEKPDQFESVKGT